MDEVLAGTVLFQGLPADAAERLCAVAERRDMPRGDVIFRQGEPGASMYVILHGKVRMTRPADPGRDNLLTLLGPGDLFGELTLFDPAPRKATATAITDVAIAEFTASAMKEWLAAEPEAAWDFLRLLAGGYAGLTTRLRISCSATCRGGWRGPCSIWRSGSVTRCPTGCACITTLRRSNSRSTSARRGRASTRPSPSSPPGRSCGSSKGPW